MLEISARYTLNSVVLDSASGDLEFALVNRENSGAHKVTIEGHQTAQLSTLRVYSDETVFEDFSLEVQAQGGGSYVAKTDNPTFMVGTGAGSGETLTGGDGNDVFVGNAGDDIQYGMGGDDTFKVSDGDDFVISGDGKDILEIGAEYSIQKIETLSDGSGRQKYTMSKANDSNLHSVTVDAISTLRIYDSEGAFEDLSLQVITKDADDNVLTDENGKPITQAATDTSTLMVGGAAGERLIGAEGDDQIAGVGGDDILIGGAGDDFLDGGDGNDTVSFEDAAQSVNVDLSSGRASGVETGDDTINVENVLGGAGDDTIKGNSDNNTLDGGAGEDLFVATSGDDTIVGGTGVDTASYRDATSTVTVDMAAGTVSGLGTDTLDGVEKVVGGSGNDVFMGSTGADNFDGGPGDDNFYVSDGSDVILTGGGTDTLHIRYGYDISSMAVDKETGALTFTFLKGGKNHSVTVEGHDTAPLANIRLYSNAENTEFQQFGLSVNYNEAFSLYRADTTLATAIGGSLRENFIDADGDGQYDEGEEFTDADGDGKFDSGDDALMGGIGDDLLIGNSGNDNLAGGAGDDVLMGGVGDDRYLVDAGDDLIFVGGGEDTLRLSGSLTEASFVAADEDGEANDLRFTGRFGGSNTLSQLLTIRQMRITHCQMLSWTSRAMAQKNGMRSGRTSLSVLQMMKSCRQILRTTMRRSELWLLVMPVMTNLPGVREVTSWPEVSETIRFLVRRAMTFWMVERGMIPLRHQMAMM